MIGFGENLPEDELDLLMRLPRRIFVWLWEVP